MQNRRIEKSLSGNSQNPSALSGSNNKDKHKRNKSSITIELQPISEETKTETKLTNSSIWINLKKAILDSKTSIDISELFFSQHLEQVHRKELEEEQQLRKVEVDELKAQILELKEQLLGTDKEV